MSKFCIYCGKELKDTDGFCSGCGVSQSSNQYQQGYSQQPSTNSLAIVALVLAFVVPIAGLIIGISAKNQIKRTGEGGADMASAAIIISSVFLAISAFILMIYFIMLFVLVF